MIPTNKLRFVQRPKFEPDGPPFIRVLQQWWEFDDLPGGSGEWRDVELTEETND